MLFTDRQKYFGTVVDTVKRAVSIKIYIRIRTYKSSPEVGHVYLVATGYHQRERIDMDICVHVKDWIDADSRLKEVSNENQDKNLLIDNYIANVTAIRTNFRLENKILTPALLRRELKDGLVRLNFTAFFKHAIEEEKTNIHDNTYDKHVTVYNKFAEFRSEVMFAELELKLFNNTFRKWLKDNKRNAQTTINSNLIVVKKYLHIAVKSGIKLKFDVEDVYGGNTNGNRTYLSPEELKNVFKFFRLDFINDSTKLITGYFLFACMTGLRIGDLQAIERADLEHNDLSLIVSKTSADQNMVLNMTAREILKECELLFVKKFSEKHLNEEIKKVMVLCKIRKHVTIHVARHTFATCFLRAGGTVHHLQKLLKHKDIKTTMVYVHILEIEANQEVFKMDNLF